jgi:DNA-binding IclR family transcriptional regulator
VPRPSPQTDRVVAVLNLLAESADSGATLSEIARRLDINRATCVHMLAALEGAGYLVRDPVDRRYHLGPALVGPGVVAARRYPALGAAREEMNQLTRTLARACFAFVRDGNHARLAHYTWDLRRPAPALRVGDLVPLTPPLGAVFIAWAESAEVDDWLARAPSTTRDDGQLRTALSAVRELGYVVELQPGPALLQELVRIVQQQPDGPAVDRPRGAVSGLHEFIAGTIVDDRQYAISSISVPVFDGDGRVSLALNLVGSDESLTGVAVRRLAAAVVAAAGRIRGATDAPS